MSEPGNRHSTPWGSWMSYFFVTGDSPITQSQNPASSSEHDSLHKVSNSATDDSGLPDRPASLKRKQGIGSSVSTPDTDGVSHTVTNTVAYDTRPSSGTFAHNGNNQTMGGFFGMPEGRPTSLPYLFGGPAPTKSEDWNKVPSPGDFDFLGTTRRIAQGDNFQPAPMNAEDRNYAPSLHSPPSQLSKLNAPPTIVEKPILDPSVGEQKTKTQGGFGPSSASGEKAALSTKEFRKQNPFDLSMGLHQKWENERSTPPPETLQSNPPASTAAVPVKWLTNAINAAKLDVFTTLTRKEDNKAPKTAALNIAAAQRLVLAHQQWEISQVTAELYTRQLSDGDSDILSDVLQKLIRTHCNAVRDLEYMQQRAAECGKNDENDPFYLKSSKEIDRLAMQEAGLIPDHVLPAGSLPIARDRDHPVLPGIPRSVANKANKLRNLALRFGMASAGGLSLITPVLIMANVPGIVSSLVTTCVAMLLFAIGITLGTDLKPDQVLGATAAYAAVLVVFVGTSLAETTA